MRGKTENTEKISKSAFSQQIKKQKLHITNHQELQLSSSLPPQRVIRYHWNKDLVSYLVVPITVSIRAHIKSFTS